MKGRKKTSFPLASTVIHQWAGYFFNWTGFFFSLPVYKTINCNSTYTALNLLSHQSWGTTSRKKINGFKLVLNILFGYNFFLIHSNYKIGKIIIIHSDLLLKPREVFGHKTIHFMHARVKEVANQAPVEPQMSVRAWAPSLTLCWITQTAR